MISHANDFRSLPNLIRPVVGRAPAARSGRRALLLAQAFVGSVAASAPVVAPQVLQALEGSDVFFSGRLYVYRIPFIHILKRNYIQWPM